MLRKKNNIKNILNTYKTNSFYFFFSILTKFMFTNTLSSFIILKIQQKVKKKKKKKKIKLYINY